MGNETHHGGATVIPLAGTSRVLIFPELRAVIMQTLPGAREAQTASRSRRQSQPFMSSSASSEANETIALPLQPSLALMVSLFGGETPWQTLCHVWKKSLKSRKSEWARGALDLLTGPVLYLSLSLHVNNISHHERRTLLSVSIKRPSEERRLSCAPDWWKITQK